MKSQNTFLFIGLAAGAIGLVCWSSHLGRQVWSPEVFAWRNPLKPSPKFENQTNSPARLVNPRYYSFMSIGSSIGSVLKVDLQNVSHKAIHSYTISFSSPELSDNGAIGSHPEPALQPDKITTFGHSTNGNHPIRISIDFIQFADGSVWYADPIRETVKPAGVKAGAEVSAKYLRQVLETYGMSAVLDTLPYIRTKIEFPGIEMDEKFGYSGFYCGVTKTVVRVEHLYQKKGFQGVEDFLFKRKS